jgi:thiol-disulfide isomerase/thioredoxin
MRNLTIIFTLLLSAFLSFGQGIEFFEGSYKTAFEQAGNSDQLVFVDAYAVWCGPCKRMSKQVFPKAEVGDFFNSNFVNMKIDMEKGQGLEFGKTYPVSAYPSFFFINGEGEVVHKFKGARDEKGLIAEAKKALAKFDNSAKYAKLYEEGDRSYTTVYKYIKALNNAGESSLKIANDYILDQKNLSTEDNIKLLFEATTEVDSKIFDHLVANKKKALKYFTREEFNDKVVFAAMNTFEKSLEFQAPSLEKDAVSAVKKYAREEMKKFELEIELVRANRINDSTSFVKTASKYHNQIIKDEEKEELSLVDKLLKAYERDPAALNLASDIAVNVATNNTTASNCLLACRTLIKVEKWKEAKMWAEKAVAAAGDDRRAQFEAQQQLKYLESK